MGKDNPIVTLEKIRDELIVVSQKVKRGELTPNVGNAMVNALRSSAQVEQMRYQQEKGILEVKLEQSGETELTEADRARLDKIAKLLSEEPSKKSRKK